MRRVLVIISLVFIVQHAFAQQEAQYSLYQTNNFLINPAVAGSYEYWNVKGGFRKQWVGMEGGPTTMFASFHGRLTTPNILKSKRRRFKRAKGGGFHHGFGAKVYNDQAGAITYSGFSGSYAVHMKLNRWYTLSFGASLGMKTFRLDGSKLKFVHTPDDPDIGKQVYSDDMPDLNVGFWLYSDKWFFGGTARQLLRSDITIQQVGAELEQGEYSRLYSHFFVTAGRAFEINPDWTAVPSVMLQYVHPAPPQFDLNTTFWYRDKIGLGVSYRNLDAVYVLFEYIHNQKFEFSYAFDFTISELTQYNSGSHEVVVGYRFGSQKRKVRCPAKYW